VLATWLWDGANTHVVSEVCIQATLARSGACAVLGVTGWGQQTQREPLHRSDTLPLGAISIWDQPQPLREIPSAVAKPKMTSEPSSDTPLLLPHLPG